MPDVGRGECTAQPHLQQAQAWVFRSAVGCSSVSMRAAIAGRGSAVEVPDQERKQPQLPCCGRQGGC
jgi:hypothetical protein